MARSKNTDDVTQTEDNQEKVAFGDRPELATGLEANNLEIQSHNWQPDSPAVDMRDAAGPLVNVDNLVQRLAKEQEDAANAPEKQPEVLTKEEHKERTQLDVSDPNYVNSSLDHHTTDDK